jgi:hypothetical protein
MKFSEEELDSWFIELPFDDKKKFYRLWYDQNYNLVDHSHSGFNDLFICESNTPDEEN